MKVLVCSTTLALTLLTSPLQADWCSGTWLPYPLELEMKLSDRVANATDALGTLQKDLQKASTRLKLDVEANRTRLIQRIRQDKQFLYDDISTLCKTGRSASYPFQGKRITLQDADQFHAYLRMHLGLYQAHTKAEQELLQRVARQQELARAMSAKYNELAVLALQAQPLQGLNGTVPDAERFVQTTCLTVKAGDTLLETAPTETLEELLGEILRKKQQPASDSEVSTLLADCETLPAPAATTAEPVRTGWFERLFSSGGG